MCFNYKRNTVEFLKLLDSPRVLVLALPLLALALLGASFGGSGGSTAKDSANRAYTVPVTPFCLSYVHTVVSVGNVTEVLVPSSRQPGSRWVQICDSAENTGSPKVKCYVDPPVNKPRMGLAEIGDVLDVSKHPCEQYLVDQTHPIKCIADTAATATTTDECVPESP